MALIEHIYLPKDLDDIIIPNKKDILNTVNLHISNQDMNLLLIGSSITFKSIALQLIVKKYYNTQNIQNYNSYILILDCFNDINISNLNNDIKTFCKNKTLHKKFLIIDNFDIINETNQQYLKLLIDTCPNTFFIFGCENTNKINEIIQTRTTPIYFEDPSIEQYREIITNICIKEQISFDIKPLLEYKNITAYFIYNLFNKLKLLKKTNIEDITPYIIIIDTKEYDKYNELVKINNVKQATKVLFDLFDKGYSLLDIYNFLYEYYKLLDTDYKYKFIEQICLYIQYIYDGFDNKLMLLFFTNDLITIYNKYI
jgi:DNA polymerase III delta prime subunit